MWCKKIDYWCFNVKDSYSDKKFEQKKSSAIAELFFILELNYFERAKLKL